MSKNVKLYVDEKETIYHYTSADGFLGILQSSKLWFTESSALNDESEGKYIFDIAKEILVKGQYDKGYIDFALDAFSEKPKSKHFICSFSRYKDSLPLWQNYTKNLDKAGYNIAFQVLELRKAIYDVTSPWNPNVSVISAVYDREVQEEIIKISLDKYYNKWKEKRNIYFLAQFLLSELHIFRFQIKHEAFEPENEVRCVIQIKEDNYNILLQGEHNVIKFRNVHGIFVPYIEIPINAQSMIKSVSISPYIKDSVAYESTLALCKKYGISCDVEHSTIPIRY